MDSRFSVHTQGALPSLCFSHNSHGARATLWAFRASHQATVQGPQAIHTWPVRSPGPGIMFLIAPSLRDMRLRAFLMNGMR
jgi:hypothetical protein